MSKIKCCVGIGQLNKYLYMLLIAALLRLLSDLIYGLNNNDNYKKNPFYIYNSILKNHIILKFIMKFFGVAVLSFFYSQIENQKIVNTEQNNNDYYINQNENLDNNKSKNDTPKILLIHNEIETEIDNTKYIPQILFVGFLLGLVELMDCFYSLVAPPNTDYWTFEILFTVFFIKKIFKNNLYIHQIFSTLFVVTLCSLIKLFLFIKQTENLLSLNLLFIPFYLLIIFIRSYTYTKIKWLIDIRYIGISKMLFIYGIFGFFISLIICIITSIFPGLIKGIYDPTPEPYSINIGIIIVEIIFIITYMCLKFFTKFFYMLILKRFSPIHILATNSLYFFFVQIILIVNNDIYPKPDSNKKTLDYFICSLLIDIFAFFGYMVFMELIELKCLDCNFDLKRNIIRRSGMDSKKNMCITPTHSESDDSCILDVSSMTGESI